MLPLISDAQFNSIALVIIAVITVVPTTLAAYWSRSAKKDSAQAKENSASALHEVQTNGGMSDPKPNLNDHIKYQTDMTEWLVRAVERIDKKVDNHLTHSRIMDEALAEVYMEVRPSTKIWPKDDLPPQPPT